MNKDEVSKDSHSLAEMDRSHAVTGFPPILGENATILILGTMPSVRSLEVHEYYGHPQNAFWKIMGDIFHFERSLPYEERKNRMINENIAIWDVLRCCCRRGSADASIVRESEEVNDFISLFSEHSQIEKVLFNGRSAESLFYRHVIKRIDHPLDYLTMPSTSPAYASMRYDEKLSRWREAILTCQSRV